MIFGDLNLGIDEFFVGMTGPINPAAVFMIQYDRKKGNTSIIFILGMMSNYLFFFGGKKCFGKKNTPLQ